MKLLPLPDHLFMNVPSYSFTGTQTDPTDRQMPTLANLMIGEGLLNIEQFYWHFGDCIGSDKVAFDWVTDFFMFIAYTVAHPGHIPEKRAYCKANEVRPPMENIARNMRVAYLGHNGLFALTRTCQEVLRSGTWSTIRAAGKLKRRTWIIDPNGGHVYYPEGYTTVLTRPGSTDKDSGYF